jgi:hypothetical protein
MAAGPRINHRGKIARKIVSIAPLASGKAKGSFKATCRVPTSLAVLPQDLRIPAMEIAARISVRYDQVTQYYENIFVI